MNKLIVFFAAILTLTVISCSNDSENQNLDLTEVNQTDLSTVLEVNEIISSVDEIVAEVNVNNLTNKQSTRKVEECYAVESTVSGYTVTFNNCVLNESDNVNGTLEVRYSFNTLSNISSTAVYKDFYVGTTKLNGTRTYTMDIDVTDLENLNLESQATYTVNVTSDMQIEMEDGSSITETGNTTITTEFDESTAIYSLTLTGNWTVIKDGNTYTVEGTMSSANDCIYWTSGLITLGKNGLTADVDFGDGTCDDKATLIYPNNVTQEITL